MAQAKVPVVLSVPQTFCVTVKVAAEPGKADRAIVAKMEQAAKDRFDMDAVVGGRLMREV